MGGIVMFGVRRIFFGGIVGQNASGGNVKSIGMNGNGGAIGVGNAGIPKTIKRIVVLQHRFR
jgi:hypothetical protein